MPINIKLIDRDVVLMQFVFEKEVSEMLQCINGPATPFLVVDRWIEVIGSPPCPSWVRFFRGAVACLEGGVPPFG